MRILLLLGMVTLFNLIITPYVGYQTVSLVFLLFVMMLGLFAGRGQVLFGAAATSIVWNFLFIPPLHTLSISRPEDLLMFLMYFITATVTGSLTSRLNAKEWVLRQREKSVSEMYDFSRLMNSASGKEEVAALTVNFIDDYFKARSSVITADEEGKLSASVCGGGSFDLNGHERGVAEWTFLNRKPAGVFTETLPDSEGHYLPLLSPGGIMGVLCVRPGEGNLNRPQGRDIPEKHSGPAFGEARKGKAQRGKTEIPLTGGIGEASQDPS